MFCLGLCWGQGAMIVYMTPKNLPLAYKLAPGILVATLVAAVFFVSSSVSENDFPETAIFKEIFSDYKKQFNDIKKLIGNLERAISPEQRGKNKREISKRERERRLAKIKEKAAKPGAGSLAGKQRVILDFDNLDTFSKLQVNKSNGAIVSFGVVQKERDEKAGMVARLLVENIGGSGGRLSYGGGDILLPVPAKVGGKQAIEVTITGEGASGFGIGLFSNRENEWLQWDLGSIELASKEWATYTISFVDFNLWRLDKKNQTYRAIGEWTNPEAIDVIRIYLVHRDLVDGKSATLWVDKVALR